ncbi:Amino acid adenylation [Fusarium austroafricanum]|uniref:Amino acid adenylation n=1 Tax=Fusarium austroafricanum TaxID=2364996 RepID=A0A8H4KNC4_9HYPO|nr:Amino acid adenylation [Fusarium austroafricanum]
MSLYQLPSNRVIERRLCVDYYRRIDSSKIQPDGSVDENLCKTREIEKDLGRIQGVMETLWVAGDFVMTIPLSFLAEKWGRQTILRLNLLSRSFMLLWAIAVGRFDNFLPTRAIIVGPVLSVLGGDCVFNSLTYGLVSNLTDDHVQRAIYFGYMSSVSYVVALLGPALASSTMTLSLWLPFWLGILLLLLAVPTIQMLPASKQTKAKADDDDEGQHEPLLSSPLLKAQEDQKPLLYSVAERLQTIKAIVVSHPKTFSLLLFSFMLTSLASSDTKLLVQYISARYQWTFASAGYLLSGKAVVNFSLLTVVIPKLLRSRRLPHEDTSEAADNSNIRGAMYCLIASVFGAGGIALASEVWILIPSLFVYALGSALPIFTLSLLKSPAISPRQTDNLSDSSDPEAHVFSIVMLVKTIGSLLGAPLMAALWVRGLEVGGIGLVLFCCLGDGSFASYVLLHELLMQRSFGSVDVISSLRHAGVMYRYIPSSISPAFVDAELTRWIAKKYGLDGLLAIVIDPQKIMSRQGVDEKILNEIAVLCNLAVDQIEDVYACTPLQMATMAESTIHAGASVFRFTLNLSSDIDINRFCSSLSRVVSLNAVLRTRLVECRQGLVQVVTTEQHHTHLSNYMDMQNYIANDEKDPLGISTTLFRTAIVGSQLLLTMHHGIMDHASLTPIFEDVLTVYHGGEPKKRADFRDFVDYCLKINDSDAKSFWSSRFTGSPAIFPRVTPGYVPFGTHTITQRIVLDRVGKEVSAAHVPSYIETAWALAASSYTGSDSVAFGLILSGRKSACAAAETTLGPTIAIVPVQVNLQKSTTVEGILKERTSARRQLQQHPTLQYGVPKIRTVSEPARVASSFQTLLNIRPRWYDPKESSEISYHDMKEPAEPFALSISCDLEDDGITVHASVDPKVIPEQQLVRILDQFEHLLRSLTEASLDTKLDQIPRLSPGNLSEIMKWNETPPEPEERLIHELFRTKAQEHTDSLAIEAWDGTLTYTELDEMSDRLARQLRNKGASVGTLIAFVFEKSLWTAVAIIGIIKAGAVSVPISAEDPPARKQQVISSAGIRIILTSAAEYDNCVGFAPDVMEVSGSTISLMPASGPVGDENKPQDPSSLAFVIYTSGSTGLPKGVMLEHRNLTSAFKQLIKRLGYKPGHRTLQFSAHVWDVHLGETFASLLSGGILCIPSEDQRKSRLTPFINSNRIEYLWLTPTVIRTLMPEEIPGVTNLMSVGEAITPDTASIWGGRLRLFNGWGPCESSLASAIADVSADSPYPESIGYPFNSLLWLTNPRDVNELVPIGCIGEILIDGPGVGRGYLNDDNKTKAAFIQPSAWALSVNSDKNRRIYRTGDLARYNPDGSLCFLGRRDNQVKIRGQRLELGEVENNLSSCPEIRNVLTSTKIADGRTQLLAVITLADDSLPSEGILEQVPDQFSESVDAHLRSIGSYARSSMPSYMIPTIWLVVQQMPRTESEKLDRTAVAHWLKDKTRLSSAKDVIDVMATEPATSPETEEESLLQSVWAKVLDLPEDKIGRESCFVSLGGDSILAMQVASRCLRQNLPITTAKLLRNSPLHVLAKHAAVKKPRHDNILPAKPPLNSHKAKAPETLWSHITSLGIERKNVEAVAPATDGQATMLAVGEVRSARGYYVEFEMQCNPSLDATKLRKAFEQVVRHHEILRTVFVQHNTSLFQVVLKDVSQASERQLVSFRQGAPLVAFHLMLDEQGGCKSLRLEIHHALYDAISLGLVFRDLNSAYNNTSLSEGLPFHDWVTHIDSLDPNLTRSYWKETLRDSKMPNLVPEVKGSIRGHALDKQVELRVPLSKLTTLASATPSTLVKTAWALLISLALGIDDVVFGEVSANRYLALSGIDGVRGPCVNQLPVRAHLEPGMTMASIVAQIQDLHTQGLPYHHLGTRSIIKQCTSWPNWTRFSTSVVYQNHGSVGDKVKIGDSDCTLSIRGDLGDSTDIHVIAIPHPDRDELEVILRYADMVFNPRQIQWIYEALKGIFNILPDSLHGNLEQFRQRLTEGLGSSYELLDKPQQEGPHADVCVEHVEHVENGVHQESDEAQGVVIQVWEKLGLMQSGQNVGAHDSIWDQGADIVTAFLLSEEYRSRGYAITVDDIIANPDQVGQRMLIGKKQVKTNGSVSGNNEV